MNDFHHDLEKSLVTGFIDHSLLSKKEFRPQFLVNDKFNGKKVLSTIDKGMRGCNEFWFSVAFVTKSDCN
jgi:HKD family nuclease